jgi:tetratricopeptide (TPR) repeat protein
MSTIRTLLRSVAIILILIGGGAAWLPAQQDTYPEWTKGMECWQKRDYACCASEMQKIIAQDPKVVASVYYLLGLCQVELKQYDPAVASLQKVLELNPDFGGAFLQLARVAKTRGQNEKAVEWINQGYSRLADKDSKALGLKIRGGAYLELKKTGEAEKDLVEASKLAPESNEIWLLLGNLYLHKKQNEKAFEALNKSYSLKATKEAGIRLMDAAFAVGRFDVATRVGQELVDDKGIKENGVLLKLGQAYLAQKDYEKSVAVLVQIPGNGNPKLSNLCQAYVGVRNWTEAEKYCLEWQKNDTKNALVYDLLWRVYMKQERYPEAKLWAQKGQANTTDPKFKELIDKTNEALKKVAPTIPVKTESKPS